MPFLYPHSERCQREISSASLWDDYSATLPAKPQRAARSTSHDPAARSRRHRDESASRRNSRPDHDARNRRGRSTTSQTREREFRRHEQRKRQDPDREARRDERRQARKAEREAARVAYDDEVIQPPGGGGVSGSYLAAAPIPQADHTTGHAAPLASYDHEQGVPVESRPPRQPNHRNDSWTSQDSREDEWAVDLEDSHRQETRRSRRRSPSMFDELDWYKRGTMPDPSSHHREERARCCGHWSRKRRWTVFGLLAGTIITVIIIAAAATSVSRKKYSYTPSTAQVNNTAAFASGGATQNSVNDTSDGIGAGADTYICYSGNATNFPPSSRWVSFADMWNNNLPTLQQACGWLHYGADNSPAEIAAIYAAIQDRANASLVDHRLIFGLLLQESHGCVRIPPTTSASGVRNPGLMQSHDGHSYDPHHSALSILAMVQDGTQGTSKASGDGLVQYLNTYGNPYMALRGYNSGYIPTSGDLSEAAGATAAYVSDIANRLTGWVKAEVSCVGSTEGGVK